MRRLYISTMIISWVAAGIVWPQNTKPSAEKTPAQSVYVVKHGTLESEKQATCGALNICIEKGGKPYWEIGPKDLLTTLPNRNWSDGGMSLCKEATSTERCTAPGIVAFDEVRNRLYFGVSGGSAKFDPFVLFQADLNTRKIVFVREVASPFRGATLSPSGRHLAIDWYFGIQVLDLETKRLIEVTNPEREALRAQAERVNQIQVQSYEWLDEERLSVQEVFELDPRRTGQTKEADQPVRKKSIYTVSEGRLIER